VRLAVALGVGLALLLASTAVSHAASASASPQTQAAKRLNTLVRDTRKLPKRLVTRRNKAALVRLAKSAKKTSKRNPCRSVRTLRAYRRKLKRVRRPRIRTNAPTTSSRRGQLESDTLAANVALLALPRARRCGGKSVTVAEAKADVLESDERHLRLRLSLPLPTFSAHQVGGSEYQQMFMEGAGETSGEGKPGLPQLSEFFAVPVGADVSVKVNDSEGYDLGGVNLFPHQPDPVDAAPPPGAPPLSEFLEDPFVKSKRAYRSRKAFPANPAGGGPLGNMRDLRIGGVDLTGAQYTPKKKKLHVFTSLDVTVDFGGANQGIFGDATVMNSPWEAYFHRNYGRMVVNSSAVADKLNTGPGKPFCGEDMLVVTSPTLKPAADSFANARKAAGYHPRVVLVGSAPGQIGDTLAQIQAYILGELNADCEVRPSYVILFGDTSHVPTWHVPCAQNGDVNECAIPSDLPYSLNAPSDLFADVMLGRIPAPNLDAANAVVNKMVGYETTAPSNDSDFYTHTTVTAYFEQRALCVLNEGQSGEPNCKAKNGPVTGHYILDYPNHKDGRGFTLTAENIRTAMVDAGLNVDRVYTKGDDDQVIPEEYYNGTPIPDYLRLPTFPWNGTGADLLAHYNAGRSLILHRDHGWHSGWANPYLTTADTPSMSNGTKLPVVFGVDCSSATFDIPGAPSFVETQVMKPDGGAFAGFGDTAVSPTWPNNHMAYGFFDAMFPDTIPTFGAADPTTRLGDILLSGKNYMAAKNDGAGEYQEHYLYHLLGDPSAQAWVATPVHIDVGKINVQLIPITQPGGPPFKIHVDMGDQGISTPTVITLYHQGNVVGRGVVTQGAVDITPEAAVNRSNLSVAFEQDRALPAQKAISP
jgi:Peptidase family C25/Propeptide_C25